MVVPMGEQRTRVWPALVLSLVLGATLVALTWFVGAGYVAGIRVFVGTDDPILDAERGKLLTAAFVVGTTIPLVCGIIAAALRLRTLALLNAILLTLTLLVGGFSLA